jgi:hypothetical protein
MARKGRKNRAKTPCFTPVFPVASRIAFIAARFGYLFRLSLGREMMARRFARQFCHLGEVNGYSIDAEQAAKMTAKRPPALA